MYGIAQASSLYDSKPSKCGSTFMLVMPYYLVDLLKDIDVSLF